MKVAFHLAHPAHYHLFKRAAKALQDRHKVLVTFNEKDVLKDLLRRQPIGDEVVCVAEGARADGFVGLVRQFARKEIGLFRIIRDHQPDLILGTSIIVAHVGRSLGIPSVIVNEDDFDVVSKTATIGYPFASHILAPSCCRTGRWGAKVVSYDSYHELAYLTPDQFTPDRARLAPLGVGEEPFFVLRFSGLGAHHDVGKSGITGQLASQLVDRLAMRGKVFITSERKLEPALEPYRIQIDPLDIHHALSCATLYVGDSQTMAAEAAVLGTPALRFNDFVGEISYLDELEQRYGLAYGIRTSEPERLLQTVDELLERPDLAGEWQRRRLKMLGEKIDFARFLTWFVEHYPSSVNEASAYVTAEGPFAVRPSESMPVP